MCRSRSAWTRRSRRRSRQSARTHGRASSIPTRSSTRPPEGGSPARRSPRFPSPRSPARRRPTRCPVGWWSAGSPDLNSRVRDGQGTLFEVWRFHAFFTTTDPTVLDTVAADKTHRGHAIIEQVHADLKGSALAHLPSGKFTANAAWLVLAVIALDLTRTAATLAAPTAASDLARATTPTVRRKLIQIPRRIATSARRLTLHLP